VPADDAKLPDHEAIYRRIRDMILFGEVAPGEAVTILGLTGAIGAGMTPVRESIRRLTAEGALESLGNRRVCVPRVSSQRLAEIRYARLALEPHLVRLSAERMNPATLVDLRDLDGRIDAAIERGNVEGYLEYNYRFHFRLYHAAEALVLTRIAQSLWLQIGPALRIVCGLYGTSNLPDKHYETLEALRDADGEAAARAIRDDIAQGMDLVGQSLHANARPSGRDDGAD